MTEPTAQPDEEVFRAYDIRGVADSQLSDAFARDLGRAFASKIRRATGRREIAVGRDNRPSSERLFHALTNAAFVAAFQANDPALVAHLWGTNIRSGAWNPANSCAGGLRQRPQRSSLADLLRISPSVSSPVPPVLPGGDAARATS